MTVSAGQTWHNTGTGQSGVVERAGAIVFIRLSDGSIQAFIDTNFTNVWTQASSTVTANDMWTSLTVMPTYNPMNYGAAGNGSTDDTTALINTINAVDYAVGGLVYFPNGKRFLKTDAWNMDHGHVAFWAPNGQASIMSFNGGVEGKSATAWHNVTGVCVAGLVMQGQSGWRTGGDTGSHTLVFDACTTVQVIGVHTIAGPGVGIFHYGSHDIYNERNWVEVPWADHLHHTNGATNGWAWGNWLTNAPVSGSDTGTRGDDGIAAVTYGVGSPSVTDMEWWNNNVVDQNWGRGYSVIGGKRISIHDNFAKAAAGAAVIVASEPPSTNSDTCDSISVQRVQAYGCGQVIGHPSFLVSGDNPAAAPLSNISFDSCVSFGDPNGDFRVEGQVSGTVPNTNFSTTLSGFTTAIPSVNNATTGDTSILRTRDTFCISGAGSYACYRIHVRTQNDGVSFQQRFEYIFKGTASAVGTLVNNLVSAGHYLSRVQAVGSVTYALMITNAPVTIGGGVSAVTHLEMRTGDNDGSLSWLWSVVDSGAY